MKEIIDSIKNEIKNISLFEVIMFLIVGVIICTMVLLIVDFIDSKKQNKINDISYKNELIECIAKTDDIKDENICILYYEVKSGNKIINNLR